MLPLSFVFLFSLPQFFHFEFLSPQMVQCLPPPAYHWNLVASSSSWQLLIAVQLFTRKSAPQIYKLSSVTRQFSLSHLARFFFGYAISFFPRLSWLWVSLFKVVDLILVHQICYNSNIVSQSLVEQSRLTAMSQAVLRLVLVMQHPLMATCVRGFQLN